jgi:phage baseplate assembly protein W
MPQPGIYNCFGDPLILGVKTYPEMVDIYRSVQDSVRDILNTQIGTRRMRPTYGTNVYAFIFENNDELLVARAEIEIRRALELNEPRVDVQTVEASIGTDDTGMPNVIIVDLGYSIKGDYIEQSITIQRQGG